MQIKNTQNLRSSELMQELENGGRFVVFEYCISIIVLSFSRSSSVYFIRGNESTIRFSWSFTLITMFLGWWGIPWGPIYSIGSIFNNFSGGKNVTPEILAALSKHKQTATA
jgi:hypothetical protein